MVKIYSDGASRGNPGPSAIAFLIVHDGTVLKSYSGFVGKRTNNQAEYEAIISALECASEMDCEEVTCYLDSQLVVRQLDGQYRVRNPELRNLWFKVQTLKRRFRKISFNHLPRTDRYIQIVDTMANQTLDKMSSLP